MKHILGTIERVFNVLELAFIFGMLLSTVAFQIIFKELPCPLCLLQRLGFLGIAFGFLMNLRFGLRPSHYAIVILSALFTSLVALRQVALHVVPGTGSYGDPIFGFHLYTWSFIVSIGIIVVTTCMMAVDRQYQKPEAKKLQIPWLTHLLFAILALFIIMNIATVIFECGIKMCPEDPLHYWWPFQHD